MMTLKHFTFCTVSSFLLLLSGGARADQVFTDDVIIQNSLCVGLDCVNGENFGFDTLRLKENNLRINFDDTSTSGSFPKNDWRIIANDSSNGGANYLAIEDSTAGRTVFRVTAGARANSIFVDSSGRVGLGTSTPVVDLHIVKGDTPTVRLEQNASSGWTPQTWDIAGNETNFFIRDVTNGSKLPFRIKPSAPNNSIFINTNGDIGMGTASPTAALHVFRNNETARVLVEETSSNQTGRDLLELKNNGNPNIVLNNAANSNIWRIGAGNNLVVNNNGGSNVFTLSSSGALTITGAITTGGGTCGSGCDAVFKPGYELDSIEEHAKKMWEANYLPAVGPTIEGKPFNLTEKTGGMLNELEKAHIYIEQLNRRVSELERMLQAKEQSGKNAN